MNDYINQLSQRFSKDLEVLKKASIEKNTFNIREFIQRYGILYRRHEELTLEEERLIEDVAQEFLTNIDPYEEIRLVDDNNDLIVKFPPLFVQLKEIDESHKDVHDKIRLLANRNITPAESSTIVAMMFSSLLRSQDDDYIEYLREQQVKLTKMREDANRIIQQVKESDSRQTEEQDSNDMLTEVFDTQSSKNPNNIEQSDIIDSLF